MVGKVKPIRYGSVFRVYACVERPDGGYEYWMHNVDLPTKDRAMRLSMRADGEELSADHWTFLFKGPYEDFDVLGVNIEK